MAFGDDFTPDQYQDIYNAANSASWKANVAGLDAAKVADPYGYDRRNKAADAFDKLLENPGQINSSPFFRYLRQQQMAPVRSYNAAHGLSNSGRGQLALQKAAAGAATEAFFPLLSAFGKASGEFNPLSPVAAGYALRGSDRSQDYDMTAAAAKAAGKTPPPSTGPSWMNPDQFNFPSIGRPAGGGAMPSGGSSAPYSGGYSGPAYTPSFGSGSGYMTSDYGTTTFGGGSPTYGTPDYGGFGSGYAEQDYWGYE